MSAANTAIESVRPESAATVKARRHALLLVLFFASVSILPPFFVPNCALQDFRALYIGTRSLLAHHNPYQAENLDREYKSEDGPFPVMTGIVHQNLTLYVNLPTTFLLVAPIAGLGWGPAHFLWMVGTSAVFLLGLVLMWRIGAAYSLEISTILACFLGVNCPAGFLAGNTAALVIGLCVIAVWCFLRNRFVWAGVLCLALSLAIKPHDSGFVWLFFLLAGGMQRKRALQSLAVTAALGLAAALWLGHVAPHWLQDWHANLATIGAPGGINDPGPHAITGHFASSVVDLQAALSIFRDDSSFYNPVSYAVCGLLLLLWTIRVVRSRFTVEGALLALSAVTAFTMLITYHRPWDAKLVMLVIPACCMLWARGGRLGKCAFLITLLTVVINGELTMGGFTLLYNHLQPGLDTFGGKIATLLLIRPVSLTFLAIGIFYLWLFVRPPANADGGKLADSKAV